MNTSQPLHEIARDQSEALAAAIADMVESGFGDLDATEAARALDACASTLPAQMLRRA